MQTAITCRLVQSTPVLLIKIGQPEALNMERIRVSSSNLASVGYDPSTQTLEVEFRDGSVYQYSAVSSAVYAHLMSASSHGSYFSQNIRERYRYRKVR